MSKQITQGLPAGLRKTGAEDLELDMGLRHRASSGGSPVGAEVGAAKGMGGTSGRTIIVSPLAGW